MSFLSSNFRNYTWKNGKMYVWTDVLVTEFSHLVTKQVSENA